MTESGSVASPYLVRDGLIQAESCGLLVAEHCNLSCRGCSSLSPALPHRFLDADSIERDLALLATAYRAGFIRVLGGEPLLHPRLLDVFAAVRRSGVAPRIEVVTNGVLLSRMAETFWRAVDLVIVSSYPGTSMSAEQATHCQRLAERHGVALVFKYNDEFREQVAIRGAADAALVQQIYNTCQIAHVWRCQIVADGHFFKCPQAYTIPKALDGDAAAAYADGVRLSARPGLRDALLAYLQAPVPLQSCRRCLGAAGRLFAHRQVDRRDWLAFARHGSEELYAPDFSEALAREPQRDRATRSILTSGISRAR